MKKVSPAVIGAFVIGAFVLGTLALLFFGGINFFRHQQRFIVFFDESIVGLDLGSAVKLRGVAVGTVKDVKIRYDPTKNGSVVEVQCELNRNIIRDQKGVEIDVSSRSELQSLIDHGLRAQLDVVSFATGLAIVALDFKDPRLFPADPHFTDLQYPVIPSILSVSSEIEGSATEILGKLRSVDFVGLAGDVRGLIKDTRAKVDGANLAGLLEQWQKTGAAFEELARSPQVKETLANLNLALGDLRTTLADLHRTLTTVDTQVGASGAEIQTALARTQEAMQQFSATAATLRRFIDAQENLGDDTHHALTQLSDAAESVQRLADFLERNPNALISGRKQPQ